MTILKCDDCELLFSEDDIEDEQIDDEGDTWCACGCELTVWEIGSDYRWEALYGTQEE